MTSSNRRRTPTSEADPLAADADNAETVPNVDADHPIESARERVDDLVEAVEDPPAEP